MNLTESAESVLSQTLLRGPANEPSRTDRTFRASGSPNHPFHSMNLMPDLVLKNPQLSTSVNGTLISLMASTTFCIAA